MKKISIFTSITAAVVLVFSSMATTQSVFSDGSRSSEKPYQIATASILAELVALQVRDIYIVGANLRVRSFIFEEKFDKLISDISYLYDAYIHRHVYIHSQ